MVLTKASLYALLAIAPLNNAFTPTSLSLPPNSSANKRSPRVLVQSTSDAIDVNAYSGECLLTPEGYGFSSPADRILESSSRETGFYKASGGDRIIDVMSGITQGDQDVALVYDGSEVLGLFTETDYIEVRF